MKLYIHLFTALTFQFASISAIAQNWTTLDGTPWRNASGQCWRSGAWTPATAHKDCDGAIALAKAETIPAQPTAQSTQQAPKVIFPPAIPKPSVKVSPVVSSKVTFSADALFDFDKSILKSQGKISLDSLVKKIKSVAIETVIAIGHTDSVGTDVYNKKLSFRRAEAVKSYLINNGIKKELIYTEGNGESKPIATNETAEGRAKNRRVEIEVIGKK